MGISRYIYTFSYKESLYILHFTIKKGEEEEGEESTGRDDVEVGED